MKMNDGRAIPMPFGRPEIRTGPRWLLVDTAPRQWSKGRRLRMAIGRRVPLGNATGQASTRMGWVVHLAADVLTECPNGFGTGLFLGIRFPFCVLWPHRLAPSWQWEIYRNVLDAHISLAGNTIETTELWARLSSSLV